MARRRDRVRKGLLLLLAILPVLLAGCRGGGWVFKGFHEDQDKALLERLAEKYPEMGFTCTGQEGGSRHRLLADDGTEFTAWTAAGARGSFQVIEYYLEEWLAAQGFYDELEEKLAGMGFQWEYSSYNYYDRHFEFQFGGLDDPQRRAGAVEALEFAHERFGELMEGFQQSTGGEVPASFWLTGTYLLEGEEHFSHFYLSPPGENIQWGIEEGYDDYGAYFDRTLQRMEKAKAAQGEPGGAEQADGTQPLLSADGTAGKAFWAVGAESMVKYSIDCVRDHNKRRN